MASTKSPQEKKQLSLERDRRIIYGENAKSSRKNIPRSNALSHKSTRKAANTPLQAIKGAVQEEDAIESELTSRTKLLEKKRKTFVKQPDLPLGAVLARKAASH